MHDEAFGMRVAIVEASEAFARELARALGRAGFAVDCLDEAPRPAAGRAGFVHACHLIDVSLPGAMEWLSDPAARGRSVAIVSEEDELAALHQRFGADVEILRKPFTLQQLVARLLERVAQSGNRPVRSGSPDAWLSTRDPALASELERAFRLARGASAICIEGEHGTGRRDLARALHAASPRAAEPFLSLDAARVADWRAERGMGEVGSLLERASFGSLLLIEPGDWPAQARAMLAVALREGGGAAGARLFSVSQVSLERLAEDGRLPAELHHRLTGVRVLMPSLRARCADQRDLVLATVRRLARSLGRATPPLHPNLLEALVREGFPGNRLGLERRLLGLLLASDEPEQPLSASPPESAARVGMPEPIESLDLRALERETVCRALARVQGNRTHAARALGISVRTLRNKIHEYGLR